MSKHTPGPWKYSPKRSQPELNLYRVTTTKDTAAVFITSSEADAHLIAAGPDLLEACKGIQRAAQTRTPNELQLFISDALKLVQAAIAKAEGKE